MNFDVMITAESDISVSAVLMAPLDHTLAWRFGETQGPLEPHSNQADIPSLHLVCDGSSSLAPFQLS